MQKQFVIAALLSSTLAAGGPCVDAYTDLADAELLAAKNAESLAKSASEKMKVLQDEAQATVDKYALLTKPISEKVTPFTDHFNTANANKDTANKAFIKAKEEYNKSQQIDLGDTKKISLWESTSPKVTMSFNAKYTDLTTLKDAIAKAGVIKEDADKELVKLEALLDKQQKELTRRMDQDLLYKTAKEAAEADVKTYDAAKLKSEQMTAAKALTYDQLKPIVDGVTPANSRTTAQLITALIATASYNKLESTDLDFVWKWREAQTASGLKKGLMTTASTNMDNAWNAVEGRASLEKKDYTKREVYDDATVCNGDASPDCKAGDTMKEVQVQLKADVKLLTDDQTTAATKQTDYATAYNTWRGTEDIVNDKSILMLAREAALIQLKTDADTDAKKDVLSKDYFVDSTKSVENGTRDRDATNVLIAAKKAEIARLANQKVVAGHIWKLAADRFGDLLAKKDAAEQLEKFNDGQAALAKTSLDRAKARLLVYQNQDTAAGTMFTAAEGDATLAKKAYEAATAKVGACTLKVAAALANCKGVKYKIAQEVYAKWDKKREDDRDTAKEVKEVYTKLAAAPTGGVAGTRCEFPPLDADKAQGPRPECAKEPLHCCGAASKYLRDGTRLTVETCQPRVGTHSYKFYPKLKEGALKQPTPEMWRFYCIEGAQKLAATLAAGIGAAYFMA